jgi:hypothetical protein
MGDRRAENTTREPGESGVRLRCYLDLRRELGRDCLGKAPVPDRCDEDREMTQSRDPYQADANWSSTRRPHLRRSSWRMGTRQGTGGVRNMATPKLECWGRRRLVILLR